MQASPSRPSGPCPSSALQVAQLRAQVQVLQMAGLSAVAVAAAVPNKSEQQQIQSAAETPAAANGAAKSPPQAPLQPAADVEPELLPASYDGQPACATEANAGACDADCECLASCADAADSSEQQPAWSDAEAAIDRLLAACEGCMLEQQAGPQLEQQPEQQLEQIQQQMQPQGDLREAQLAARAGRADEASLQLGAGAASCAPSVVTIMPAATLPETVLPTSNKSAEGYGEEEDEDDEADLALCMKYQIVLAGVGGRSGSRADSAACRWLYDPVTEPALD